MRKIVRSDRVLLVALTGWDQVDDKRRVIEPASMSISLKL
jgi:hypothetical protein